MLERLNPGGSFISPDEQVAPYVVVAATMKRGLRIRITIWVQQSVHFSVNLDAHDQHRS